VRVLALTHVFPRWAHDPSAPFLLTWARALVAAGADVGVLAPHDAGLPGRHVVEGVPVRRVRYAPERRERWERLAYRGEMHQLARRPSGPLLVGALLTAMAASLRAQVRLGRPDVVHAHWWLPGMLVARLARLESLDVAVVCTVHGTDVALAEARPALAPLARWALGGAARVEAVSSDLAVRLERVTGRVVDAVNPMPLPVAAARVEHVPGAGALRLLGVGRMVPEKGFADLLDAAARVGATVTLVGDGPERRALQAQARALGVDAAFPGRLDAAALRAAYARADVVVVPSHREGLGLVTVEALLAGVPVVAADSGGVRDVLPPEGLVPPRDPAALAGRIAAVAADLAAARAEAAALGEALRARFSPEASAARTLAGYERRRVSD
jgi:glycosyltransferase involved in cell wall biosynthesis